MTVSANAFSAFNGGSANTSLNKRRLGSLEVSAHGLGCMNFGWAYGNYVDKNIAVRRQLRDRYHGMAACKKALGGSDSGYHKSRSPEKNLGALKVSLTPKDIQYIDEAYFKIKVVGERTSPALQQMSVMYNLKFQINKNKANEKITYSNCNYGIVYNTQCSISKKQS